MISLKKSFIYKDLCYLMILWSVKLPVELYSWDNQLGMKLKNAKNEWQVKAHYV